MKALRTLAATLLLPVLAAACGDAASPTAAKAPTEGTRKATSGSFYVVCPSSLPVGGTGICRAISFSGGAVYPTWYSSNPAAATVSSAGVVYGNSPGSARINAFSGGYSGAAVVSVYSNAPAVVTRVTVTSATVNPGTSAQLTARVYDQYGKEMTGQTVTWSIDDPSVATITSTGVVTGQAIGSTTARATVGTVSGAGTVSVEEYVDPGNPMCGNVYC